jgi:hypothetical protein
MIAFVLALAAADAAPAAKADERIPAYAACAGVASALLETASTPTNAERENYLAWISAFTGYGVHIGMAPNEIDARLDAARQDGLKTVASPEAAERVLSCTHLYLYRYVPQEQLRTMSR